MVLKLLQLNIFQGKFIDEVIKFVKKEDINILVLEEVTGGKFSLGGKNFYPGTDDYISKAVSKEFNGTDCFEKLITELDYNGEKIVNQIIINDPSSYMANAILFKKELELINRDEIWMKGYREYEDVYNDPAEVPRSALSIRLKKDENIFNVIGGHLAWGPDSYDEEYKLKQAKVLFDYVKSINIPYVFTGDFNLTSESQAVKWFSDISRDLSQENKLSNTLNPNVHPVKRLFPPGLAVDYVFTSKDIKVKNFRLVDEIDLSDHYGLLLEFEI